MITLSLEPIPNQSLTFQNNGLFFSLTFKSIQDMVYASVSVNNVVIVANTRCVASALIIPFEYLEDGGNFSIVTNDNDNPDFNQFGVTQFLLFYSALELEAARG